MRIGIWLALAWLAPALIAEAAGWKGVWGSGGAFVDYIVPLPVAGGVLHVPSLVVVTLILATQPWSWRFAGYVVGVLLALSLVGVALLLDLNDLKQVATTDVPFRGLRWQQNPVGLFILTDSLLAQLFLLAFQGRWPDGGREWLISAAIAAGVPVVCVAVVLQADPRQHQTFVLKGGRPGPSRGDQVHFVYSRLPIGSDAFKQEVAKQLPAHWDPRMYNDEDDVAVLFFDSLEAASLQRAGQARLTLCLYDDGTPQAWLPGSGDCFSRHESFTERVERFMQAQDGKLPFDVRSYLGRRQACAGTKPIVMPAGINDDNSATRTCKDLDRMRAEALKKHGSDDRVAELLK